MNPEDQNNLSPDNNQTNSDEGVKIEVSQVSSEPSPEPVTPEPTVIQPTQEPEVSSGDSTTADPAPEQPQQAEQPAVESESTSSEVDSAVAESAPAETSSAPVSDFTPPASDATATTDQQTEPNQNDANGVSSDTSSSPAQPAPDQPTSTPTPAQTPSTSDGKPSNTLGIISIVLAFIAAPIGFITSIISIIKGFKKGNKTLGVLGIIGVIIALFITPIIILISITAFSGIQEKANWINFVTKSGEISGSKYKIDVPKAYVTEFKEDSESAGYGIKAQDNTYKSQTVVSVSAYPEAKQIQSAFTTYQNANPADKATFEKSFGDSFKTIFEAEIGCKNTKFSNFAITQLSGTTNAMKFSFDCDSKTTAGTKFKGELIIGVNDKRLVGLFLASESETWQKHADAWPRIISSFKLD